MQRMWLLTYGIILTALSVCDVRTRKIPGIGIAAVYAISGAFIATNSQGGIDWWGLALSVMPGMLMMALSLVTEGKIGMGDGILTCGLGLGLGLEMTSYVIMGALVAASVTGMLMLALRKVSRSTKLPFVPFVTFGLGVMALVVGKG